MMILQDLQLWVRVMCMFCRSLFVLSSLFEAIVSSVLLRFMDSSYPFGIFKLFLQSVKVIEKFYLPFLHRFYGYVNQHIPGQYPKRETFCCQINVVISEIS